MAGEKVDQARPNLDRFLSVLISAYHGRAS